jgi:hypothetical protein
MDPEGSENRVHGLKGSIGPRNNPRGEGQKSGKELVVSEPGKGPCRTGGEGLWVVLNGTNIFLNGTNISFLKFLYVGF